MHGSLANFFEIGRTARDRNFAGCVNPVLHTTFHAKGTAREHPSRRSLLSSILHQQALHRRHAGPICHLGRYLPTPVIVTLRDPSTATPRQGDKVEEVEDPPVSLN